MDLARVLELLNTSQRATAGDKADSLKEAAAEIRGKLEALVEQQRAVVEKSKALAAKDEFRPEDVAVAKELAAQKEALAKLIEQMLTDAHAFPDLRPMNELREELTKIYEDVIQQDSRTGGGRRVEAVRDRRAEGGKPVGSDWKRPPRPPRTWRCGCLTKTKPPSG